MSEAHPCPRCKKPMLEEPKFPGMWRCPDYRNALNDAPPYKYACTGLELTDEGAALFDQALMKEWVKRN